MPGVSNQSEVVPKAAGSQCKSWDSKSSEVSRVLKEGMGFDLVFVVLLTLSVAYILNKAKRDRKTWEIRRIPGLDAIEEGIGRATEMDRPVFYLPGSGGFEEPQLLASMAVLAEVARMTARYDTRLIVCVPYSGVYPVMQEIVRQAYVAEGKADSFRTDDVRWFSDHYFGYALGIVGLMFKEQVATNIMIGNFAFDALMYAEAANQAGAIQVGGTAAITQIPFFVAACDYALIGDEMYAAAAYLTKDPVRIATIVAEDWGKFFVAGLVALGALLQSLGAVESLNNILNR
jgi:hypothetical protein